MKTKECSSCAMEVDAKSRECPICGYEFAETSKWVQLVAILLAIVLIAFLVF